MLPPDNSPTLPHSSPASTLLAEGLIDLAQAAACFADGRGRKPHIATLRRWAKNGCRGHKLEVTFLGNRLMTSRQAAERFLVAINGQSVLSSQAVAPAAMQAGELLKAAGL
jgi:hypothetical protein